MIQQDNSRMKAFFRGFASVFDLTGDLLRDAIDDRPGKIRDAEALANDWRAIGADIRSAIQNAPNEAQ